LTIERTHPLRSIRASREDDREDFGFDELALRNLRESLLRNSLTTVGISVGVASLVAMLSLGIGLRQLFSQRLAKSGLFDTVLVTSRRDLRNFDRNDQRNGPAPGESRVLDEDARRRSSVCPTYSKPIRTFALSPSFASTISPT